MRMAITGLVALTLNFAAAGALAQECNPEESRAANTARARAKSAEAAGDLGQALQHLQVSEARFCLVDGDDEFRRVAQLLGNQAEKNGRLEEAFDYFTTGFHYEDAKRVGLAQFRANPTDHQGASGLLRFMEQNNFADEVAEIRRHARAQVTELLSQEEKSFAIREPHTELLEVAESWLLVAGDSAADVKRRALQRADEFAALDYHYALYQALNYYDRAGAPAKQAAVKAKAEQLAAGLASGDRWGEAVELYMLADDERSAEELRARRSGSAATTEAARKETFDKEADALEKELGL